MIAASGADVFGAGGLFTDRRDIPRMPFHVRSKIIQVMLGPPPEGGACCFWGSLLAGGWGWAW
jgi:hypothetical protein